MTENDKDEQLAQYRRKLEDTAALVAHIRHEINNPLTGVLGQTQLLLREVQRPSGEGENEHTA